MTGLLSPNVAIRLRAKATLASLAGSKPLRYLVLLRHGEVWQDWTEWYSDELPVVISNEAVRKRLCAYYIGRLEMELHAGRDEKEAMVALVDGYGADVHGYNAAIIG